MSLLQHGFAAIGKLLIVFSLAAAFFAGLFGVVYLQLSGEEIEIPKIVGKNFNEGQDELAKLGLRVKRIASRYSNEDPNTILEQRPRAGTIAKSGLIISVIVSEANPDSSEAPVDVKDDEQAIEEIEELPELKTEKAKRKSRNEDKKDDPKTRDVIEPLPPENTVTDVAGTGAADTKSPEGTKPVDKPSGEEPEQASPPQKTEKPKTEAKPAKPSGDTPRQPGNGEVRPRKSGMSNSPV